MWPRWRCSQLISMRLLKGSENREGGMRAFGRETAGLLRVQPESLDQIRNWFGDERPNILTLT